MLCISSLVILPINTWHTMNERDFLKNKLFLISLFLYSEALVQKVDHVCTEI